MLIGEQAHGYYGLDIMYTSKGIIKRIKMQSDYYRETLKVISELEPRKKVEDFDKENVLYNETFQNNQGDRIFWPYLDKIEKRTYGDLKNEHEKMRKRQDCDKKLARYFEKITINQGINENYTIAVIGETGYEDMRMELTEEKDIYTSLVKLKFYRLHVSEVKWIDHFSPDYIDFKEVWVTLQNNMVSEKTRTCIWEQIHLNFFTTYWFNKIGKENNICPLCKIVPDTRMHILLDCYLVKKLWKEIEEKLMTFVPIEVDPKEMVFGLANNKNKPEYNMRNWITYKLRECLSRQEKTTYDKPNINNEKQIRSKFNKEIVRELTYKYLYYKKERKLEKFLQEVNCRNEFVKFENGKIIVNSLLELTPSITT